MKVDSIRFGTAGKYGFLVVCDDRREAAIVDPGQAEPVIEELKKHDAKPVAVWLTHQHADCTGGVQALIEQFPGLQVVGHEVSRLPWITQRISAGDRPGYVADLTLTVGSLTVRVLLLPGHTTDSVAYHVGSSLFVGDTLQGCGCGRNFEMNLDVLKSSLELGIARLPPSTKIFCGRERLHENLDFAAQIDPDNVSIIERLQGARTSSELSGGSTEPVVSLAEELQTNPFLRCTSQALQRQVLGRPLREGDDESFRLFSYLMRVREQYTTTSALPSADSSAQQRAESPSWVSWLSLDADARERLVSCRDMWSKLTDDQKASFLATATWRDLRRVPEARQAKMESLVGLDAVCRDLDLRATQIFWLMSTRKLPGWLVHGSWKYDREQVGAWVKSFGGQEVVRADVEAYFDQSPIERSPSP